VTTPVQQEAALAKLARLLDVGPAEVAFLDGVDLESLATLRDQVSDLLARDDAKRLRTVMAAAKLVPVPLAATIGEKWFGAAMCARFVGLVDPRMARQYARYLSVDFMADITARTDPRAVGGIVDELPLPTMQAIAATLLDRDDPYTLSHFVGYLPPEVVVEILAAIDDDAALVRIAGYVENVRVLDPVVALLPEARLVALVRATERDDLWPEALHLFGQLSAAQITRIATLLVHVDGILDAALKAFGRHDLWQGGLQLLDALDPEEMELIVDALDAVDDDTIELAVAAAEAHDVWEPLVRAVVAAQGRIISLGPRVAALVERVPATGVARFSAAAAAAGHPGLLEELLGAGSGQPGPQLSR
jgi:hypothetical protein